MNGRQVFFGIGIASLVLAGTPDPALAQRVAADIHIGGWPVAGTIHIGDRYGYPRPRRVIYERANPRRIAVRYDRGWRPWKHRDARLVVVYYDQSCDEYYDDYRRGLDEVRVYQDGDRFYRFDNDSGYDRYERDGSYRRGERREDRDWDRDRRRDRDRDEGWRNRDQDRDRDDDHDRDHPRL